MLHFPSTNSAAHRAAPTDVTRLHQLLGDHVWAFSNCRVDAPGLPVAEVDWLFYNTLRGTFILSEWKRYPAAVAEVKDVGEPWALANGAKVANPIEQVARQLDAVRTALRLTVAPRHFPALDPHDVNPYQCVYSPQLEPATRIERLRFGVVHGALEGLAGTVERRYTPTPLILSSQAEHLALAGTLSDLFRCSVPEAVHSKLAPPAVKPAPSSRIAAIHRELAALHLELAPLLEAPAPAPAPVLLSSRPKESPVPPSPPTAPPKAAKPSATGHLRRHVTRLVPASEPNSEHLRDAFLAALQDGQLRSSGVHIGLFGALVGQHLTGDVKLADLAPGGLRKWCQAQAEAAGVRMVQDPKDPAIVRMTRTTDRKQSA
ncbi:hypothetical protein [Arthrobacter sp. B0490]|uniref:hypothetical protein n=1 Tax=Arthrobacter sp. B0490 TaxID=2058891 RepID=UPI000CE3AFA9|nr:hypothetical protein [Arthrobacter sp. B0490]